MSKRLLGAALFLASGILVAGAQTSSPPSTTSPPDNQSLGDKSIGCVGRHPLQGCQRSREIEERDVGLQQHDGIVRQHRAVEQPRDKLEHELYLEHAGLNERSGKSPALLTRHRFQ